MARRREADRFLGSKGVSVIRDSLQLGDAIAAARRFSRNGVLIAEEYVPKGFPHVVGGDIFVVDGRIRFWGLMSCLRDEDMGGLVPTGKMLPAGLSPDVEESIRGVLQRLVSSLNIRQGELNVEVIVSLDGTPYVLELGARAGGNMIPIQLSDASGIDLVAANIQCAMGEDPGPVDFDGSGPACAHVVLHAREAGLLERVEYGALAPSVYREVLYRKPGERVERFGDAGDAVGIAFIRFGCAEEMRDALSEAARDVRVVVS